MTKRQREIKKLITEAGLELVDVKTSGSGHYRSVVKAPNGVSSVIMFSATPSCSRGQMNRRADLRRFYRQNEASVSNCSA